MVDGGSSREGFRDNGQAESWPAKSVVGAFPVKDVRRKADPHAWFRHSDADGCVAADFYQYPVMCTVDE